MIENLEGEIWIPAKGYDGIYEVSNMGRVKSLGREIWRPDRVMPRIVYDRIMKPSKSKSGYLSVELFNEGNSKRLRVNRVVALSFLDNPLNKSDVNHKNGIRDDNRLENLEWMTASENLKHSFAVLNRKHPLKGKPFLMSKNRIIQWKKTQQISLDGVLLYEHMSMEKAIISIRATGKIATVKTLRERCKSGTPYKGFIWKIV